jgi:hypothetical protein
VKRMAFQRQVFSWILVCGIYNRSKMINQKNISISLFSESSLDDCVCSFSESFLTKQILNFSANLRDAWKYLYAPLWEIIDVIC